MNEALPYIWIGMGVISVIFGVLSMYTRKRIFYTLELAIILVLAFLIYDGNKDSQGLDFTTVLFMGFTSIICFALGFGVMYLIKKQKGTLKEDEKLSKKK